MGDEWTVVGGKGKPRRRQPQQQQHGAAAAVDGGHGGVGLAEATTKVAATIEHPRDKDTLDTEPLPGWEELALQQQQQQQQQSRRRRGNGARARAARTPEERLANLAAAVDACRIELAREPVISSLRAAMRAAEEAAAAAAAEEEEWRWRWARVERLTILGLGCVEDARVSRYQLAFSLHLRAALPNLARAPQASDPAFSELDAALFQTLGIDVAGHEDGAALAAPPGQPTLFYMPHCEAALTERLLEANWARLPSVAVVGNSFAATADRWAAGVRPGGGQRPPARLLRLVAAGAVIELPVPDGGFHVASAFNDTSLHVFPPAAAVARALAEPNL